MSHADQNHVARSNGPDLASYDEPGRARQDLFGDRYDPLDPDGRLRRRLENAVGPDPLGTVDQWKDLLNPHYNRDFYPGKAYSWEQFRNNGSAVVQAGADILQGRGVRLADGGFRRVPTPPTDDNPYEWVRIRSRVKLHSWQDPADPADVPHSLDTFTQQAYRSVADNLTGRPPGTVAASCIGYSQGSGHWLLAYVDPGGRLRMLDLQPQPAVHTSWPPPASYGPLTRLEFAVRAPSGEWQGQPEWAYLSRWETNPAVGGW